MKSKNSKGKKGKLELVFNEKARTEFLTGFTKRKNQRKKVAQDKIQKQFKEEMKVQREKAKEIKDRYVKSFQDIKEGYLQNANSDDEEGDVESEEENFETDTVAVTIKPILTTSSHLLMNHRQTIERLDNKKKKPSVKKEEHSTKLTMNFGEEEDANDDEEEEEDDKSKPSDGTLQAITSKKDLNKILKQTARSFMKKSKVVQKKNLANHKKNVKFSQRKKFKIEKKLKKHKKLKK